MEDINKYAINDFRRLFLLNSDEEGVLKTVVENLTVGVCLFKVTKENRIEALYLSDEYFNIIGYSQEDYRDNIKNVTSTVFDNDVKVILEKAKESLEKHIEFDYILRGYKGDKSVGWFHIKGFPIDNNCGDGAVFLALIDDVTTITNEFNALKEIKNMKNQLEIEKQRYKILEETVEALLFEYVPKEDTMIFSYNFPNNHERKIIHNYKEFLEKNPLVHKIHIVEFKNALFGACVEPVKSKIEYLSEVSGRGYQWHRTYYSSVLDKSGNIVSVMGRIYNIDDEVRRREQENVYNKIDRLTGAYVREAGYTKIMKFRKAYPDKLMFLIMVDMDNFKYINDNFGHTRGDDVLKRFTQLTIEIFKNFGIVIRFGGDEFIIVTYDTDEKDIRIAVDKLKMTGKDILGTGEISLEFSTGLVRIDEKTLEQAFDEADKLMYNEKKAKKQTARK